MLVDMDCQARLSEVTRMGLDAIGLATQRVHLQCHLMRKPYLQPMRAHTRNHDFGPVAPMTPRKWIV